LDTGNCWKTVAKRSETVHRNMIYADLDLILEVLAKETGSG
jgi:hypothetical protein